MNQRIGQLDSALTVTSDEMVVQPGIVPSPPARDDDRPRVVIVDDHQLLAQSLAHSLQGVGLDAESVYAPAVDLLAELAAFRPTLVLLDLDLGSLGDGRDLIEPLRRLGAEVVVLTGVTDEIRLAECIEAGASGVLAKSMSFSALCDAVVAVVEGLPLLSSSERARVIRRLEAERSAGDRRLAPFRSLTARESEVLQAIMQGLSAADIAEEFWVSVATIRTQIRSILAKLGVSSQLAAVAAAHDAGWQLERP